jgi:hypothetical protein
VATEERALALAISAGQSVVADGLRARLDQYRKLVAGR